MMSIKLVCCYFLLYLLIVTRRNVLESGNIMYTVVYYISSDPEIHPNPNVSVPSKSTYAEVFHVVGKSYFYFHLFIISLEGASDIGKRIPMRLRVYITTNAYHWKKGPNVAGYVGVAIGKLICNQYRFNF